MPLERGTGRAMALMYFQVTSLGRAQGRSAVSSAAYRSGERLRDQTRGRVYDHSRRRDIAHREIFVPRERALVVPDWVQDRNRLWNAAEMAETRSNARVAREYVVALPPELSAAARVDLARRYAQFLADRHGTVVDLAAHQPRAAGDPRNYHAHLLATTREITGAGLGAKAAVELNDTTRRARGLPVAHEEIRALRGHWSEHANQALHAAGLELRLDPRTLRAQGIDREPRPSIPMAVIQMERRGIATEFMQRLREREARALEAPSPVAARALSLDERQARARERWLAYRQALRSPAADRALEAEPAARNKSRARERSAGLGYGD